MPAQEQVLVRVRVDASQAAAQVQDLQAKAQGLERQRAEAKRTEKAAGEEAKKAPTFTQSFLRELGLDAETRKALAAQRAAQAARAAATPLGAKLGARLGAGAAGLAAGATVFGAAALAAAGIALTTDVKFAIAELAVERLTAQIRGAITSAPGVAAMLANAGIDPDKLKASIDEVLPELRRKLEQLGAYTANLISSISQTRSVLDAGSVAGTLNAGSFEQATNIASGFFRAGFLQEATRRTIQSDVSNQAIKDLIKAAASANAKALGFGGR